MTIWLVPLESNPDVLNKFIYNLGVSKKWNIVDVIGLEPDMLEWVPQPVRAVILLFPCSDKHAAQVAKENAEKKANPETYPTDLFYMRQTIRNACGTIALIHSIANNPDVELEENGILTKYLNQTRNLTPEERGRILEGSEEFIETHKEVAQEGQTEAPDPHDKVNYHFIAFVNKNGQLFELDGSREFPVKHGPTSSETFLQDAAKICKTFMEDNPDEVRFNVIALTPTHD
ncbi:ubiquitin carboxyl-terminal hydrolase-like [Lutzomyia longipalpis]|uniref:ubiquitin carboxyl-terminal hydrolase-like n=1 Tax=Lutzomyia longipalpis TaxID=7200 RepID=UPI002483CDA3|nr:ubiquitin carboxyl-terminal hydrolase-like [Lutzomyia longipalpis]